VIDVIYARLRELGQTVAVAESITGGELVAELSKPAGASLILRGGVVAYQNDVKIEVLGVSAALIATYGVVSAEVAREMAAKVRERFSADWGLATTGVAGPDSLEGVAPGVAYIAVVGASANRLAKAEVTKAEVARSEVAKVVATGARSEVRETCVKEAIGLLAKALE
jgi:nicotinamide-nucleotide amidase